jgi:hypothetical protein
MPENQVFRFLFKAWDIDKAKAIIDRKPRQPKMVQIGKLAYLRSMIHVDKEYAATIDLERADPLIAVPVKSKEGTYYMIIDGWHRIERAVQLDVPELPAYLLTMNEARRIEL